MKRREILRYTALITGSAVSAPLMSTILSGCTPKDVSSDATGLTFFKPEQFDVITELVDLILPKTDSPSASEMNVHRMIDQMVGTAYLAEEKAKYEKSFNAWYGYLDENNYTSLNEGDKVALLQKLELSDDSQSAEAKAGYRNIKQQTIAYYLSTEEIGTKFLNYLPVPGEYEGCISLEDVGGKAWAI